MSFEHYIRSNGKNLRCGFTTGTCAALAAKACAECLLTGYWPKSVALVTPKGWKVEVKPEECLINEAKNSVSCCISKDAGNDIDCTANALIKAEVRFCENSEIIIEGGNGVGRVTKPGLDQPIGAAAINSVPRSMITSAVKEVADSLDYSGGFIVIISVPNGKMLAEKTFNPMLGIEGGISILGTSGIVEPMSLQALIDTIKIELKQLYEEGHVRVILVPGNYGMEFLKMHPVSQVNIPIVRCSNFIGDALDECGFLGYKDVLLVGHAGKLIKLAGGIMNTHSRYADCRVELFCAYAAIAGAKQDVCLELLNSTTTDACLAILKKENLDEIVIKSLLEAIRKHLKHRSYDAFRVGAIIFSNVYGELGRTEEAKEMIREWNQE